MVPIKIIAKVYGKLFSEFNINPPRYAKKVPIPDIKIMFINCKFLLYDKSKIFFSKSVLFILV